MSNAPPKAKRSIRKGGVGQQAHQLFVIRRIDLVLFVAFTGLCYLAIENRRSTIPDSALVSLDTIAQLVLLWLGIVIAERQFSKTIFPYLRTSMDYGDGMHLSESDRSTGGTASGAETHLCYITNYGPGRALLKRVRYRLVFWDGPDHDRFDLTFEQLVTALVEKGLRNSVDFKIKRLAEGGMIGPESSDRPFHASNARFDSTVKFLDIRLVYDSLWGHRFVKDLPIFAHYRERIPERSRILLLE